eukprot:gene32682-42325_t
MEEALRLFKSTREYFTPVLTSTAFYDKGMLTPDEFVRAGDHLVRTCPSWHWEAGEKSKERPYLPHDKQFLITHGVPSYSRVSTLHSSRIVEENVKGEMGEGGGDWCAPNLISGGASNDLDDEVLVDTGDAADEINITENLNMKLSSFFPVSSNSKGKEEEYLDMEDESLALDDASTLKKAGPVFEGDEASSLILSRRYDISITYDNYYRVPRIWLFGFDENGSALSPTEVFQDIIQDYAKKTVTIDQHPHLSSAHASIHPCQHAPAMLRIIESLKECSSELPTVDQYLFFFLKFIQSVVPTIEYDYTTGVQVRGR